MPPTRSVRKWLQLRLHAWLRGRSVELVQVTPHYLQQLDVSHCPITRVELSSATLENTDASIDRVRNDAGYAAGNLAVMSTKANHAKAAYGFRDALQFVKQIEAGALGGIAGLSAAQWSRVAVLCSFVEPLPHDEACRLPLLVLPPNRLRLFNPVQALQALATRLLVGEGFAQRASRLEALLPGDTAQRAFRRFVHALLPRVLTAGKSPDAQALRWALEDAWHDPLVMARWHRFALLLTPEQCERVVQRAAARGIAPVRLLATPEPLATEGWALDDFGLARPSQEQRPARQRPLHQRSAPAAEQAALPL